MKKHCSRRVLRYMWQNITRTSRHSEVATTQLKLYLLCSFIPSDFLCLIFLFIFLLYHHSFFLSFFISLCDKFHMFHLFLFPPEGRKCKFIRKLSNKIQSKKNLLLVTRCTTQAGVLFMIVIYLFPSHQRKQEGSIEIIIEQRISTILHGALRSSLQQRNKTLY
jgi:hypothetical protein